MANRTLLEREAELEILSAAVGRLGEGAGGAVAIERAAQAETPARTLR